MKYEKLKFRNVEYDIDWTAEDIRRGWKWVEAPEIKRSKLDMLILIVYIGLLIWLGGLFLGGMN